MSDVMLVLVGLDNGDNALPNDQWRDLQMNAYREISLAAATHPATTYSSPSPNPHIERKVFTVFTITPEAATMLQDRLLRLAGIYGCTIGWSEMTSAKLLTGQPVGV
jgi:hypothetical protein